MKAQLEKNKKFASRTSIDRDNHPLIVKKVGESYTVVDGNRRLRAAVLSKKTKLPCFISQKKADPIHFNHWVIIQPLVQMFRKAVTKFKNNKYSASFQLCEVIIDSLKNSEVGYLLFEKQVRKEGLLEANELLFQYISDNY